MTRCHRTPPPCHYETWYDGTCKSMILICFLSIATPATQNGLYLVSYDYDGDALSSLSIFSFERKVSGICGNVI
jgi:hypothetical protein